MREEVRDGDEEKSGGLKDELDTTRMVTATEGAHSLRARVEGASV